MGIKATMTTGDTFTRKYPCLLRLVHLDEIAGDCDVIVFMEREAPNGEVGHGTVVATQCEREYPVGYRPGVWALDKFVDFHGSVTMENK